jgi:hypothetical protein
MDHTTATIGKLGKELMGGWEQPSSLSEMERTIKRFTLWLGRVLLGLWLKWEEGRYPAKERARPHCGGRTEYQRQRAGTLHTLFGSLKYRRTPARSIIKAIIRRMRGWGYGPIK